jgi:hypothetical protein
MAGAHRVTLDYRFALATSISRAAAAAPRPRGLQERRDPDARVPAQ